jgi:hypothetical protein
MTPLSDPVNGSVPPFFAFDAAELVSRMGGVSLVSPPLAKLAERLDWTVDRAREAAREARRRGEVTLWVDHKGREVATLEPHMADMFGLVMKPDKPRKGAQNIPTKLQWKRVGTKDKPDRNRYSDSSREVSETDIFKQGEQGSMSRFSGRSGREARDHASEDSVGSALGEIGDDRATRAHASSMRDDDDHRPGQPFLSPLPRATAAFDAMYLHDKGQLSTSGLIGVLEGPWVDRLAPGTLSTSLIRPIDSEAGLSWAPTDDDRDAMDMDLKRGQYDAIPPEGLAEEPRHAGEKPPCEVCDDRDLKLPAFSRCASGVGWMRPSGGPIRCPRMPSKRRSTPPTRRPIDWRSRPRRWPTRSGRP